MFTFDNTHIFTGYLKQLLATQPIPTCKVYSKAFERTMYKTGTEDPRVVVSIDTRLDANRLPRQINYIKDNSIYKYTWNTDGSVPGIGQGSYRWERVYQDIYEHDRPIAGVTKVLQSSGNLYDTATHEYLGEYLRFLRDYHDVDLMPLYNCFSNHIYNNIDLSLAGDTVEVKVEPTDTPVPQLDEGAEVEQEEQETKTVKVSPDIVFNSLDTRYRIYAFPVKLFANYTIAVDSQQGLEMFCGIYRNNLDKSSRSIDLIKRTYHKERKAVFSQPFVFDKLDIKNWKYESEITSATGSKIPLFDEAKISRIDILSREPDLKLFLKVPVSCTSTITVLEGDYRKFNDCSYTPVRVKRAEVSEENYRAALANKENDIKSYFTSTKLAWQYNYNKTIVNFNPTSMAGKKAIGVKSDVTSITKLQLLSLNTGKSYPFADRLAEYLVGSAISDLDEIPDNIERAQKVMNQNGHYFSIEGRWEPKMQKLIYDQLMVAGPINVQATEADAATGKKPAYKVTDARCGLHTLTGLKQRSLLYDILGYVDRDAEKHYASWRVKKDKSTAGIPKLEVNNTIQNVDIYNEIYDIK